MLIKRKKDIIAGLINAIILQIAVFMILWCIYGFFCLTSQAEEARAETCQPRVAAYFKRQGVVFKQMPAVVYTEQITKLGLHYPDRIYMRPEADCNVFAHEMFHQLQYELYGAAATRDAHFQRELDAYQFTEVFKEQDR
jgi:hypothetical protein